MVFSAPGRTELAGNHTDHNCGKVLAAPVNLNIKGDVSPRSDSTVVFESRGYSAFEINLDDLEPVESEAGTTAALVRGVAAGIVKRGGNVGGFDAGIKSSIPAGSGLSSSAALEILLGTVFNTLFNNGRFDRTDLALIGQEAENTYFGKPCGLMDQLACASRGIVKIDFKDPLSPVITPVNVRFEELGYNIIIVNTGSDQSDLTEDYAAVPAEMLSVAKFFGKQNLRQVDEKLFHDNINEARKALGNDRAVLRAAHFFEENRRVDLMTDALMNRKIRSYLEYMRQCGESSVSLLQNAFSPSHPQNRQMVLALALSTRILGAEGACRVHGGGFAGTIQACVPSDYRGRYIEQMERVFGKGSALVVKVADGRRA